VKFLRPRQLSPSASELVRFDADSIRQIARPDEPDLWVADPDQYERNGRVLRDSESSRMLAYSSNRQILYATDGCNACARRVPADQLKSFPDVPTELLKYLVSLIRNSGNSGTDV
jgi:hypothetical protein